MTYICGGYLRMTYICGGYLRMTYICGGYLRMTHMWRVFAYDTCGGYLRMTLGELYCWGIYKEKHFPYTYALDKS